MSDDWFHWLNVIGVAFFAVSGTLVAYEKNVDSFGVIVLASITAIGGGTLRDVLLDEPIFWIAAPDYLYSTLAAISITVILIRIKSSISGRLLMFMDGVGLGLFNIIGIEKALIAETGMTIAITLGTVTAIFGGILRDVLAREIPMAMRCELYATACIAGGLVYAGLFYSDLPYLWCIIGSLLTTLSLRLGAIRWGWRIPIFEKDIPKQD